MEETHSNGLAKDNEKEEIKHSTEKGLDAGFSKIFLQSAHGCKPLLCSSVVLDTYCQWEQPGSLCPTQPFMLLHEQLLCTAMKNCCWVEGNQASYFFLICFSGKSFP